MTPEPTPILLVDDEAIVLRAIERHLATEAYHLLTATSARQALDILERTPVHVLISDFRMPEMDGGEFLKIAAERWPDTVRMVLSGYADIPSVISAINEGEIYRFITKPWQGTELKTIVRCAVEKYRQQMETRRLAEAALALNSELLSAHLQSAQQTSEWNFQLENAAEELMAYKRLFQALDIPMVLYRGAEDVEANQAAERLFSDQESAAANPGESFSLPSALRCAAESFAAESEDAEPSFLYRTESGKTFLTRLLRVKDGFSRPYIAVCLFSDERRAPNHDPICQ